MPLQIKDRFPIFQNHPDLVYLDSASTTQRLDDSLLAEQEYYLDFNANVHRGLYPMAEMATERYEAVRTVARRFLNAGKDGEILFTRGTTEGLNIVAQCWGRKFLKKGDEVVLSVLEHHSNLVPWQMIAKEVGAVLKFCPILSTGNLDYKALEKLIGKRTKMVSITGLSNTLGTVIDLSIVSRLAKKVGAKLCIDAAQLAAHFPIDVQDIDADFLAFSSHKIYGPTGAGVLYAKRELLEAMDPWLGGGDMIREVHEEFSTWNDLPWKFEAGTPNIAQVLGMGAAMQFLMELGKNTLMKHDREMQEYTFKKLNELPFITVYGPKAFDQHRGSISFTMHGVHPHDIAAILGEEGICVRAGHHCTMPLMKALCLVSTVRVSFGIYNTKEDVEALAKGLKKVAEVFKL
ncbi:MAG: SufS family cysteine desulfurase [Candidatus Gracilibacteria bacterium]|jgi:cysteine desulfurase/selenocysteine lyase